MGDLRNWLLNNDQTPRAGATVIYRAASLAEPNANPTLGTTSTNASGMWQFVGVSASTLYDVYVNDGSVGLVYKGHAAIPHAFGNDQVAGTADIALTKLDEGSGDDDVNPATAVTTLDGRINQILSLLKDITRQANWNDNAGLLTTPKMATAIHDASDNELIQFTGPASAVNQLHISSATTGQNPVLTAAGNDTNISLTLQGKGTGTPVLVTPTISSFVNANHTHAAAGVTGGLITLVARNRNYAAGGTSGPTCVVGDGVTDLAQMSVAITPVGTQVDVEFGGYFANTIDGAVISLFLNQSGVGDIHTGSINVGGAGYASYMGFPRIHVTGLTAGVSTTFKIRWSTNSGTATAVGTSRWISVVEL